MKEAAILYPGGKFGNPTTGGQVYDFRLFNVLSDNDVKLDFIDDGVLDRDKNESVLKLPLRLISKIKRLASSKHMIFNTALFPYYILPFFILRLLYPHLKIYGIHHHFRFQEQTGIRAKIYKFLEFINLKQCDKVICPCPYTRDVLLRNWKNGRIEMLENSFDKTEKGVSTFDKYKLLYVGSVYERKGIIYLLDALAKLDSDIKRKIQLDIVGNVDETSEYVKMLRRFVIDNSLESIVNFVGRVDDVNLNKYYSHAYTFVLPSLLEGYGLVILEAMSYGLPVIAFDNSAMPYTIKNGYNGLLSINKNTEDLKNNIQRLISDSQLHRNLAANAKQYASEAYSIDEFKDDVKAFIETWQ